MVLQRCVDWWRALGRWERALYVLGAVWAAVSVALAWWDRQDRWMEPGREAVVWVKLWIFWAAWAVLPWMVAALWGWCRGWASGPRMRWGHGLVAAVLGVVAYSGLLEPRLLQVKHHFVPLSAHSKAAPLRIALVADLHVGLFFRNWQLQRLVAALNALEVDAVVVAGDWTYDPPKDLVAALAPLAQLRHPVLAVLGNHDTQMPGAALSAALRHALTTHGVVLLGAQPQTFQGWDVVGLGDLWGEDPRRDVARWMGWRAQSLAGAPHAPPTLVVAHQPDTAALLPPESAALAVSGHTHGGQITLPWMTRHLVLPTMSVNGWYAGMHATAAGPLFVTTGVGTIGLPARLAVVPQIDVLHLGISSDKGVAARASR